MTSFVVLRGSGEVTTTGRLTGLKPVWNTVAEAADDRSNSSSITITVAPVDLEAAAGDRALDVYLYTDGLDGAAP